MAKTGPVPDPRSVNRNPTAGWTTVPDEPFDWRSAGRSLPEGTEWHPMVVRWFEALAALPHATLWLDPDWIGIYDLAFMKQKQYQGAAGPGELTEIRQREGNLGLNWDARQKLRIQYRAVAASSAPETDQNGDEVAEGGATVTRLPSARQRLRTGS